MNQESANSDLVLLFLKPFIYFLFCDLLVVVVVVVVFLIDFAI